MTGPAFSSLKEAYAVRWQRMEIPDKYLGQLRAVAHRILENKARYEAVSKATNVPWFFIGCIHYRESNLNFDCHLHNGDPLAYRTRNVPPGRPMIGYPPFTWEASAKDALAMRGLDKVHPWTLERFAYEAEGYNGWGYYNHHEPSEYLWSHSSLELPGKYVRDHVWDPKAHDPQLGVMPLLKLLIGLDHTISITTEAKLPTRDSIPSVANKKPVEKPSAAPVSPPPPAPKSEQAATSESKSPWEKLKEHLFHG